MRHPRNQKSSQSQPALVVGYLDDIIALGGPGTLLSVMFERCRPFACDVISRSMCATAVTIASYGWIGDGKSGRQSHVCTGLLFLSNILAEGTKHVGAGRESTGFPCDQRS